MTDHGADPTTPTPARPMARVTDHAVLRWLERIEGVDVAALRARLTRAAHLGVTVGAPVVVVGRGRLVLRADAAGLADVAVVTVLAAPPEMMPARADDPNKRRRLGTRRRARPVAPAPTLRRVLDEMAADTAVDAPSKDDR